MPRIKDEDQFMQHYHEYMAPECRAQIPAFNRVGRGLRGDGFYVEHAVDENGATILKGYTLDARTGERADAWEFNCTDEMPRIDYRLYVGNQNEMKCYYIHFRCKIYATNTVLWEFDTPKTPYGQVDPSEEPDTEFEIMAGSY